MFCDRTRSRILKLRDIHSVEKYIIKYFYTHARRCRRLYSARYIQRPSDERSGVGERERICPPSVLLFISFKVQMCEISSGGGEKIPVTHLVPTPE